MKTNIFILTAILCILSSPLIAQDIHFSQFYQSPLNVNPALTGVMRSESRLAMNYRNQYGLALGSDAYNTFSASYDKKIAAGTYDYFGLGAVVYNDVAGEANYGITSAKLSGSFSYFVGGDFNKSHYVALGMDAGIAQRRINTSDLRWPSQWRGDFGDFEGMGPMLNNSNVIYPDLSLGLMWFSTFGPKNSFYAGAATHHVNQPNVNFFNTDATLNRRYTVHAGGEYAFNQNVSLVPNVLYMQQGPAREWNVGAAAKFYLADSEDDFENSFSVGLWGRFGRELLIDNQDKTKIHADAVIITTQFVTGSYQLGASYDLTVSDFRNASAVNGSFEFSLLYLIRGKRDYRKYYYPKV